MEKQTGHEKCLWSVLNPTDGANLWHQSWTIPYSIVHCNPNVPGDLRCLASATWRLIHPTLSSYVIYGYYCLCQITMSSSWKWQHKHTHVYKTDREIDLSSQSVVVEKINIHRNRRSYKCGIQNFKRNFNFDRKRSSFAPK